MATAPTPKAGLLDNLSVARRIYALILIPLALLFGIGAFAVYALNQNRLALEEINNRITTIDKGNKVIRRMQRDYVALLYEIHLGNRTWQEGREILEKLTGDLNTSILPDYQEAKAALATHTGQESTKVIDEINTLLSKIDQAEEILKAEDPARLEQYLKNDLANDTRPIRDSVHKEVEADIKGTEEAYRATQRNVSTFLTTAIILILAGTLIAALLGYLIYRSIATPVVKLINTMRRIGAGDLQARANLLGKNELAEMGANFDQMVEQRVATETKIEQDHRQLNRSVGALLDAVFDLSERDLTVRAKVTEDATGPLADAINQLAEDTSDVLKQVREIAVAVENASQTVNQSAQEVDKLARSEQLEAKETITSLETLLQKLDSIAQSAQQANQIADTTAQATQQAQVSVTRSVDNISNIRATVQETGKRLKRLGERSQEISQIISFINNLSERTTVLALNASMQATAAGEAGRGFSLIAEEIQRLAESSRESTEQIATLVHNIQQEANTTIATMDNTIAQVVDGSTLAATAGEQMQATLASTNQLVAAVENIAKASAEQVAISQALQARAQHILAATQTTGQELSSLTRLTQKMAEYGQRLVQSVNLFKLEA